MTGDAGNCELHFQLRKLALSAIRKFECSTHSELIVVQKAGFRVEQLFAGHERANAHHISDLVVFRVAQITVEQTRVRLGVQD